MRLQKLLHHAKAPAFDIESETVTFRVTQLPKNGYIQFTSRAQQELLQAQIKLCW